MNWLLRYRHRYRLRCHNDLAASIREHIHEKIEDLLAEGLSHEEALQRAQREFGNAALVEENCHEVWQGPVESVLVDIRQAMRRLMTYPGLACAIVLTMALGIGASTAIFTLVHATLMQTLPVGNSLSLYRIGDIGDAINTDKVGFPSRDGDFYLFSHALYEHLRGNTPEFEQLAAMEAGEDVLGVRRGTQPASAKAAEFVSGNYFTTLSVTAFSGRVLGDADDRPGAAPVVVMSYSVWRSDYASDPNVVGATLYLQGQPVTVVGIASERFFGDRISADPPAFWIPLAIEPLIKRNSSILNNANENWLYAIGRVRPGTVLGTLQQSISTRLREWLDTQEEYTDGAKSASISLQHVVLTPAASGIQELQQKVGKDLYLLLMLSALLLLAACGTSANLLLVRGTRQRADIALRMALGAARRRIVQKVLLESVLLSSFGGTLGLGVAYVTARTLLTILFPNSPHSVIHPAPTLLSVGFALVLSLVSGLLFGLLPAWVVSRAERRGSSLKSHSPLTDRTSRAQRSLVVFQALLSVVLLVSAGLLTTSLWKMQHQEFGLEVSNRYVMHLAPQATPYTPERLQALDATLEGRIAAIPGVESVGISLYSPFDGIGNDLYYPIYIPTAISSPRAMAGAPTAGTSAYAVSLINRISPGFFDAVGQSVVVGRGFTQQDTATSPFVAVVNQTFAKKFFHGVDPIGRRFGDFGQGYAKTYQVVGVVADAKYSNPRQETQPMYFRPLPQWQDGLRNATEAVGETASHDATSVVVRFRGHPATLESQLRHTLHEVDGNLTVMDFRSLDDQMESTFNQERMVARLSAFFGCLTLILASTGLYGTARYQVLERTGANEHTGGSGHGNVSDVDRERVVGWVTRDMCTHVFIGLSMGLPIALFVAHYLDDQLYSVNSYDLTCLAAAAVVILAAACAIFVPAHRAASVNCDFNKGAT
jgi:predicted permease